MSMSEPITPHPDADDDTQSSVPDGGASEPNPDSVTAEPESPEAQPLDEVVPEEAPPFRTPTPGASLDPDDLRE